ncbi:MAG: HesA/MoeB/ThiF family protein [Bacteroidia bacterium]|nr:HesA/MoeB/ThiF family protein [Bacteroidia bacterium]
MDNRYARHIRLMGFGEPAQEALSKARVLLVGCGGLGCPAGMYLARSGVGTLGLLDADVVSLTNLHRQVLFNEEHVGRPKSTVAKEMLLKANSQVEVTDLQQRLDTSNWRRILSDYDVILDCSDNFTTRYLVNDACVLLDKPLVYGAANQFEGQVAVFNHNGSGNLRDLFPEKPKPGVIQNCEEAGVLGVITGIIGEFMALEAIKLITETGDLLTNQLVTFDGLGFGIHRIKYAVRPDTHIPDLTVQKKELMALTWDEVAQSETSWKLVDVRSEKERQEVSKGGVHIPLDQISEQMDVLGEETSVLFYCKTGGRALQAAEMLADAYNQTTIGYVRDTL